MRKLMSGKNNMTKPNEDSNLVFLLSIKNAQLKTIDDAITKLGLTKITFRKKMSGLLGRMRWLGLKDVSNIDSIVATSIEDWTSSKGHSETFEAIAANIDFYIKCYQDGVNKESEDRKLHQKFTGFPSIIAPITKEQFDEICLKFNWAELKSNLDDVYSNKIYEGMSKSEIDESFTKIANKFTQNLSKITIEQFKEKMDPPVSFFGVPLGDKFPILKLKKLMYKNDCVFQGEVNRSKALEILISAAMSFLKKNGYSVTLNKKNF